MVSCLQFCAGLLVKWWSGTSPSSSPTPYLSFLSSTSSSPLSPSYSSPSPSPSPSSSPPFPSSSHDLSASSRGCLPWVIFLLLQPSYGQGELSTRAQQTEEKEGEDRGSSLTTLVSPFPPSPSCPPLPPLHCLPSHSLDAEVFEVIVRTREQSVEVHRLTLEDFLVLLQPQLL